MNYNFDELFDRVPHDAMKWEFPQYEQCSVHTKAESIIPMWVADMDFATPACVVDAIKERCEHPIFGYFGVPQRYYDAVASWQKTRYGVTNSITRANVAYQNSVLGGVASFVSAYTLPGESVLIHSSTYIGFQGTIKNLGRELCVSELVKDENGIFRMDYEDMENKIKTNKISAFIFCSPHNPTGRVWEQTELEKMIELCAKYDVKIVSDEIWADFIVDPNAKFIPTQSVNDVAKDITMGMYAPSKTFNIAGLVGAYSIIYNQTMLGKISRAAASTHYNMANVLSCHALIGGYENGSDWVDEMNKYIRGNQEYIVDYINKNFQGVKAYLPQSTYLLWLDIADTGKDFDQTFKDILATGVLPSNGKPFFGKSYIRLNAACPRSMCVEAMERLSTIFG